MENDDEKELVKIEELSQKLEQLYKDMEHIRRENLLFEAYLYRHKKDATGDDDYEDKGKGKKKKDKQQEQKLLTTEEKYDIANFESEALKKNIDEGRIKSDQVLEVLRAILEETDMAITEIRKDAFDFQREILIGGENSRTGKIEAERIEKYMEEKLKQKDQAIEKYKSKNSTLQAQILKTENQIKKKEEMGDDLKFIDFHQLQIENKKYVKEVDEKNAKLLGLKIATGLILFILNALGKIVTKLTQQRKLLVHALDYKNELTASNEEKKRNLTETQAKIKVVTQQLKVDQSKANKFTQQTNLMTKEQNSDEIPSELRYIKIKNDVQKLQYDIKNIQRKMEIIRPQYDKAKRALGIN